METVLSIHKLTKNFGKLCAVNNLNLEVKRVRYLECSAPMVVVKPQHWVCLWVLSIQHPEFFPGLVNHPHIIHVKRLELY